MSGTRWIMGLALLVIIIIGAQGLLCAQAQVQIARPLDGATVRETVKIIVPASSVPSGGYVSIEISGRRRSAMAKDPDSDTFIYQWDTKGLDPDARLPLDARQPQEGAHTIAVQAYDAAGRKLGDPKEISVTVKNKAPELMPASGLLLRYTHKIGSSSKYRFRTETNLANISGATELAATIGQAIEAADLVIAQSTEDLRPDGSALVRQKLDGAIKIGSGGRMVPIPNVKAKAAYRIEDGCGRTIGSIESIAEGTKVVVEMPNLPVQRVRIGDSWVDVDNVFQDWSSGSNMAMSCNSTLEGVEWEGGYPCAKIKTVFSGTKQLPNSPVLTEPVPIKGERITYFAFQVGKVINCDTSVTITADVDPNTVTSMSDKLMSMYTSKFPSLSGAAAGPGGGPGGAGFEGGPPNESLPPGGEGMFRPNAPSGGSPSGGNRVKVTFEVKQTVELVH